MMQKSLTAVEKRKIVPPPVDSSVAQSKERKVVNEASKTKSK